MNSPTNHLTTESRLILIVGLIQFINILDFMMVMPLGPDFARALGIPPENIGIIGGSYTLAASLSGLVTSLFLDNFGRKTAMLWTLLGLAFATGMGALAWSPHSLLAARVLAGLFGGPLFSLTLAMVADHIPPQRRGAAMGKVMGAFAAASVLGVPFGLELAHLMGWKTPFMALTIIAFIVWLLGIRYLPASINVRDTAHIATRLKHLLNHFSKPAALAAFGYSGVSMMSAFLIIPNISAHVQLNMGYPRAQLGLLYSCSGTVSFFSMRIVGKLIDRYSSTRIISFATALFIAVIGLWFIRYDHFIPVIVLFMCFMLATSTRNVCAQTLSSKVPAPNERGGFMSLLSSINNLCSALGAFMSSHILVETIDGKLGGTQELGMVSIALSCAIPFLFYITEKHIRPRHVEPSFQPFD